MAQGPTGRSAVDAAELERLRAKLDGFEAMGLQVGALRELLARDPETFRSTYMVEIRRQLDGAPPSPVPETPPPRPVEEVEVRVGPPSEEQIEEELELEGAGPEEALKTPPAAPEGARTATTAAMSPGTSAPTPVAARAAPAVAPSGGIPEVEGLSGTVGTATEELEAASEELKDLKEEVKQSFEAAHERKMGIEAQAVPASEVPVGPPAGQKVARNVALTEAAVDDTIMGAMQAQQEEAAGDKETLEDLIDELNEDIEDEFDEAGDAAADIEAEAAETAAEVEVGAGADTGGTGTAGFYGGLEGPEPSGASAKGLFDDGSKPLEVHTIEVGEAAPEVPPTEELEGAGPGELAEEGAEGTPEEEEEAPAGAREAGPKAEAKAEAEAEAPAKVSPPRTPRRRPGRAFFATAAVAMLVVFSLAGYFMLYANEAPYASFSFTPEQPVAGQPVTFDASASRDPDGDGIKEYRWTFGDTTAGKGRVVKHAFNSSGEFTVTLKVLDGRDAASRVVRRTVPVEPLRVKMAGPHVSDDYRYTVLAYMLASNPDGLYRFTTTLPGDLLPVTIVIKQVHARLAGDKSSTVDAPARAEDGFMRTHDVREETMTYDLDDVQGEVLTNLAATDTSLNGYLRATLGEKVCLAWDRSVRTDVDIDARFSVPPDFVFTEADTGTFYGQLDGIATSFSLASFLRSTEFDSEDREPHQLVVGGSTYIWRVRGMEVVEGRSAWGLHVNITMSEQSLEDAGLDAFFTDVWLEPGLSQPAKSHVHTKAYSAGDTVIVDVTETLVSFYNGLTDPGTACAADHAYTVRGEFADDFSELALVPAQGGVGGGFAFTAEDAVEAASRQVTGFRAWLDTHPSAFCHDGSYSTTDGEPTWMLSFGTKGSSEHYNITVSGVPPATLTASGASYIDDGRPLGSAAEIGPVVTLSRGIRLLRNQTEVRSNAFVDSNPDWGRFNLTIGEGAQSIPLDPTAIGVPSGSGYVYVLESHDDALSDKGRYRAGLDATNGQVVFSWTQKQTRTGRIGGVG